MVAGAVKKNPIRPTTSACSITKLWMKPIPESAAPIKNQMAARPNCRSMIYTVAAPSTMEVYT